MATSAKTLDRQELESRVKEVYREVAEHQEREFHFETGRGLAERLGYPAAELDDVPAEAIDSFAGVGYYFDLAEVRQGETAVDLGSGAGMDSEPTFLSAAEVEHLASWCAEPRLIVFAALSGLRLGEVLALRDADVNLEDGFVLVRRSARKGVEGRTKTRKRRRVYLCARALKAVREQLLARRPNSRGLVFPSPRSDSVWNSDNFRADVFAKTVKRAAATLEPSRRADFERLDFHDLRHTFASLMIAAGANPLQLAEALGHSDQYGRPDPTLVWKRYGHLYPGSTREAAKALDRHLNVLAS